VFAGAEPDGLFSCGEKVGETWAAEWLKEGVRFVDRAEP
jgi:hypothetical protein